MRRLALALLLVPTLARAEDPPWTIDTAPQTKAICQKAFATPLPAKDSAGPAPKDCDTEALLYGIGRAPDYAAARACALNAPADPDDVERQAFEGPAALATIYANGFGIARNDDLAIRFACEAGGAPAEIDGRIKHLLDRKGKGTAEAGAFDFCDDITSGLMEGTCQERDSRLAKVKRDAALAALTGGLAGAAKTSYAALAKAQVAYVTTLGENEVDMSGTARAALEIGAEDSENGKFADTLQKVVTASLPAGSAKDRAAADKALNAAYKTAMAQKPDQLGTVTLGGIKATERAWLVYRDAFVAFALAAAPNVSSDALVTILTRQRTDNLKDLAG